MTLVCEYNYSILYTDGLGILGRTSCWTRICTPSLGPLTGFVRCSLRCRDDATGTLLEDLNRSPPRWYCQSHKNRYQHLLQRGHLAGFAPAHYYPGF